LLLCGNRAHCNISFLLTPAPRWLLIRFNKDVYLNGAVARLEMIQRTKGLEHHTSQGMFMAGVLSCAMLFVFASTGRSWGITGRGANGATPSAGQGLNDGRQLFESRCAGCHGLDGRRGGGARVIGPGLRGA